MTELPMAQPSKPHYQVIEAQLPALMKDFYDRLFDDIMIGFFFTGRDKQALIDKQIAFTRRLLGGPEPYKGPSLKQAHAPLRILDGQFNRRHQVLKEVLRDHAIDEAAAARWLELDRALKDKVVLTEPCHEPGH